MTYSQSNLETFIETHQQYEAWAQDLYKFYDDQDFIRHTQTLLDRTQEAWLNLDEDDLHDLSRIQSHAFVEKYTQLWGYPATIH